MSNVMKQFKNCEIYTMDLSPELAEQIDNAISISATGHCSRKTFILDCILYGLYCSKFEHDSMDLPRE